MANYGKLFSRIWTDPEFTALDAACQQLYCLLISYSTRDHAGVLPMTLKRWARCTAGASVESVRSSLATLSERGFVVVDFDTEEVLIRTFIRNDEVYKQPKVMISAMKSAVLVESMPIRWSLYEEVRRVPELSGNDQTVEFIKQQVETLGEGYREGFEKGIGYPHAGARAPSPTPTPTPAPATAPDNDTAAPACIETAARPAKRHPSSSSKTVVRQVLGPNDYDHRTIERLAVAAEKLYAQGKPDALIREAIAEYDRRDNVRPEWLESIYGDVVKKTRAAPASTIDANVVGWLGMQTPDTPKGIT